MLLVASETGHVYTFATKKLQPMITSEAGKALIQTCLHSPEEGENQGFRRLPPIIYISSLQMTSPFNFVENIELEKTFVNLVFLSDSFYPKIWRRKKSANIPYYLYFDGWIFLLKTCDIKKLL